MRLTLSHLRRAPQFTNVILQREIDLRGLGLSSLDENALVMLNNDFDVVNLTSNALTSLEYFPVANTATKVGCMDRVTTLIAHRNQIQKVSAVSCALALPNVAHFLADRNNFRRVRDVLFLRHWKKLEIVSLEGSPMWDGNPEGFDALKLRAFLVHLCPTLKLINYARVLQRDRELAESLKREFKALVAQWDGTAGRAISADGKKARKRGRESRAAGTDRPYAEESNPIEVTAAQNEPHPEATVEAATATPAPPVDTNGEGTGNDTDEDTLQARLNELEERIMSDDITSEEIVALEQEMNELIAEQERRKKRRK